jgi:hypothetical protein
MEKTSRRNVIQAILPAGAAAAIIAGTAGAVKGANVTQPLTTVINNFVPGVGGFVGTLTLTGFQAVNNILTATATISGNVLNGVGGIVGPITQVITFPIGVSGSCQILTLTLGPLDLNLLGLAIHLNQIVLNITAVSGAGNLLGNLLCSVANLLNGGGPLATLLTSLAGLLNQILGAL